MAQTLKAYRITPPDWMPPEGGITWGRTRSKARYHAYLQAQDVGYDVSLTELKLHRAPEYDDLSHLHETAKVFNEEYLSNHL